jgi:ribosome-associated protein
MESKRLALRCRELADNKKAENLVILDLRKLPGVTDFMVLCSGTSEPHLRAIEEEIVSKLRDTDGLRPRAVDGTRLSGWIVLDYVDVLVHVMKPDLRDRYDLEGLWNDAPRVRGVRKKVARPKKVNGPATQPGNPS